MLGSNFLILGLSFTLTDNINIPTSPPSPTRLSDDGDRDAADSDSDSDGSVIIRSSPEPTPPLDSDDDSDPGDPRDPSDPTPDPSRRKRVSFSGSPAVSTVHVYDRDEPMTSAGTCCGDAGDDSGDGDGGGGDDDDGKSPAVEDRLVKEPTPPVSILKPSNGRPSSPAPPAPSPASAAAAAAAAGAAWAAGEVAGAAEGRVRWLADGESVPIVTEERGDPSRRPLRGRSCLR